MAKARRKTGKQIAASRRNIKKAQLARRKSRNRKIGVAVVASGLIVGGAYYGHKKGLYKAPKAAAMKKLGRIKPRKATANAHATRVKQPFDKSKAEDAIKRHFDTKVRPTVKPQAPAGYSPNKLFEELDKADAWLEGTRSKKHGTITQSAADQHYQRTREIWKKHG